MYPDDSCRRGIDQVPVVDSRCVAKIRTKDRGAFTGRVTFVGVGVENHREKADLMPRIIQQPLDLLERKTMRFACDAAHGGNTDTEKAIAFAILSRSRLEVALQKLCVVGIAECAQMPAD